MRRQPEECPAGRVPGGRGRHRAGGASAEVAKPIEVEEEETIEALPDDELDAPELDASEAAEAEEDIDDED